MAVSRRVRVASRDDRVWVGVDAFGKGGAEIIKGKVNVTNGVLLGISDVLTVPPDLGQSPCPYRSSMYSSHLLLIYSDRVSARVIRFLLSQHLDPRNHKGAE